MEREQEEEGRGGRLMKMVEKERREKIENRSENDEEKKE